MSFELEGKLIEKFDLQQVTGTFRKREFVIEKTEDSNGRQFIETIKFQLIQDRCEQLDKFQMNDSIKVTFNIKGRRWEKNGSVNYFNNLEAWRIEPAAVSAGPQDVPPPTMDDLATMSGDDTEDDLPF